MKKLLILFFLPLFAFGQDTVIQKGIYTSYFSYKEHNPLYVVYKLYKGGGTCSRAAFKFITDGLPNSATASDYAHSGFDEGHLVNAADFAFDCKKEEMTFRFYNCVPQKPRLNRGIWKKWETSIRKDSQTDSLLIICGSIFGRKKIGNISVPDYCWKIVKSLSTHKIYAMIFPNDDSDSFEKIELKDLLKRIPYHIKEAEQ